MPAEEAVRGPARVNRARPLASLAQGSRRATRATLDHTAKPLRRMQLGPRQTRGEPRKRRHPAQVHMQAPAVMPCGARATREARPSTPHPHPPRTISYPRLQAKQGMLPYAQTRCPQTEGIHSRTSMLKGVPSGLGGDWRNTASMHPAETAPPRQQPPPPAPFTCPGPSRGGEKQCCPCHRPASLRHPALPPRHPPSAPEPLPAMA
jgi:hypothetical protein